MFRSTPVFFAAAVALMACGNPASETPRTTAQPPQASQSAKTAPPHVAAAPPAAFPTMDVAAAPPAALPTMEVANAAPESARCLDLVNDGAFKEAIPVCVRATGLDPENTAVKQALEKARTGAASAALGGSSAIPVAREDLAPGVALDGKLP